MNTLTKISLAALCAVGALAQAPGVLARGGGDDPADHVRQEDRREDRADRAGEVRREDRGMETRHADVRRDDRRAENASEDGDATEDAMEDAGAHDHHGRGADDPARHE